MSGVSGLKILKRRDKVKREYGRKMEKSWRGKIRDELHQNTLCLL